MSKEVKEIKEIQTNEELLRDAIIKMIFNEPFFSNLIMQMKHVFTTDVPTLGVSVTEQVNLYVNPDFFRSLSLDEQVEILKHECIFRDCLVETDKGPLKIGDIVNKRLPVKVLSVSKNGKLEYKKVTDYSKKPMKDHPNKRWVSVKYTTNDRLYRTLKCTNDHKIAVIDNPFSEKIKYVKAEDSVGLFSVRKVNEERPNNKERYTYNKQQSEVVIGCLLGDSNISKLGQLSSIGSKKHEEYIKYKQSVLGGRIENSYSGYKDSYSNLRLYNGASEQTKYLRNLSYLAGKKTIKNLTEWITPISLAFWFMDDGSRHYWTTYFHTEGFSFEDQQLLAKMLKEKYDITAQIKQRSGKEYLYNLKLDRENSVKLFDLVAPYIHPSMAYKLHENWHHLTGSKKINSKPLEYSLKKIVEVKNIPSQISDLYDITVEDNHNFFANNTLVHNCMHVINAHFVRFKDLEPNFGEKKDLMGKVEDMLNASRLNRAADYAINEYLPNIPKKFNLFDKEGNIIAGEDGKPVEAEPCTVESLQKQLKNQQVDRRKNLEYYYELLKEEEKNGKGGGNGKGKIQVIIDDHSKWAEGFENGADADYLMEKVKQTVDKAVEATKNMDRGNIPGDILAMIEAMKHKPKDWKSDIRRFVARTAETVIESTRKVRHRRYSILYPGNKVYPRLHLAVGVDTSGSVHDEALNQCFAEIAKIHNKGEVKVTVIEADTQVNQVYEFDPKKPIKVVGRGGTLFKCVFDKCAELDVDGLIFITDGGNFDTDSITKPRYQLLWALYEGCSTQYKFGARTEIKIKKKQ